MDDVINKQAAINIFDCSIGGIPVKSVKYVSEYADKIMNKINALPPAQPEIIRCKDCVHYYGEPGNPNIICFQMHEDDFCSYGERREE